MEFTEEHIKAGLDGTFTIMKFDDYGPVIVTEAVALDFLGDYAPREADGVQFRLLTEEEGEQILLLREQGLKWKEVAAALRCSTIKVFDRYKELCKERGVSPIIRHPRKSDVDPGFQAAVARLKDEGLSITQISLKLKCKFNRAAYAWERERDARKAMREAA